MAAKKKADEQPSAFKHWINEAVVDAYARGLRGVWSEAQLSMLRAKIPLLSGLELKDRVRTLAEGFHEAGRGDHSATLQALLRAVRQENLEGFSLWPLTHFIQVYGLDTKEQSLQALHELTQRFTAEFAIRPFLVRYPELTETLLPQWARDPSEHVRRLVSEGTRPFLPWGERLARFAEADSPAVGLLEELRFDPSLYVRKSVANHWNDLSRKHPTLVVETLARWERERPDGFEKEFEFLKRRALRTLIKQGHAAALRLVGVEPRARSLEVVGFQVAPKKLRIGESLELSLQLRNTGGRPISYLLDYRVFHRRANGGESAKVFKGGQGTLAPGESKKILKRHSFREVTTRKYYPGAHRVELLINGGPKGEDRFQLLEASSGKKEASRRRSR